MIEQKHCKRKSRSQLEESNSHLHELQEFYPHVEASQSTGLADPVCNYKTGLYMIQR